ncbi:13776_t:CDS:2, partial [Entrophospora sp. SA101]
GEIRTKRAYGKITVQEQKHIRAHIQLPTNSPKSTLIHSYSPSSSQRKEQTVRLHGAVECVHPRCPARRIKYTTRGSDTNAAANITLSGASIVLAADFQPLSPFYRNANHTRHNLANELLSVMTPELVPRDFIRDE